MNKKTRHGTEGVKSHCGAPSLQRREEGSRKCACEARVLKHRLYSVEDYSCRHAAKCQAAVSPSSSSTPP
ncbi:hypothetical protein E2C01_077032 [Portunus trituberculatus]|uniref:Uncharacterized protein n=1 Tax=Portunus trituberculatus TaxID=210409 RepID=A0A5B7IDA1_PORTR|nr:hypothetical protein [Portunus trituberculatus]